MSFQQSRGVDSPVIPLLDDDFVTILQDVAVGEESLEVLEKFLEPLRRPIEDKVDQI